MYRQLSISRALISQSNSYQRILFGLISNFHFHFRFSLKLLISQGSYQKFGLIINFEISTVDCSLIRILTECKLMVICATKKEQIISLSVCSVYLLGGPCI